MNENEEKVNSFVLYTEQWPAISLLNAGQRSCLMQAIFALHGACSMPELDDMTKAIFLLMKPRFEENKERYAAKCEANKANGKKGGRPKKQETEQVEDDNEGTERFINQNPKTERFSDGNPKTLSDSDTDSDSDFKDNSSLSTPSVDTEAAPDETQPEQPQAKRPASPACPYEKIIALYHQALPEHQAVKVMSETRRGHIKARWAEVGSRLASMGKASDEASRLAWLERFFKRAAGSDFLTGKVTRRDNGRPFMADLDFLFSPKGFAGVIEGKYDNREVA